MVCVVDKMKTVRAIAAKLVKPILFLLTNWSSPHTISGSTTGTIDFQESMYLNSIVYQLHYNKHSNGLHLKHCFIINDKFWALSFWLFMHFRRRVWLCNQHVSKRSTISKLDTSFGTSFTRWRLIFGRSGF